MIHSINHNIFSSVWRRHKTRFIVVFLVLIVIAYCYQRVGVIDVLALVKIRPLNMSLVEDEWNTMNKGGVLTFLVTCQHEHDKFIIHLPMKGNEFTEALLYYSLDGTNNYTFPFNKMPYTAIYSFRVNSNQHNVAFKLTFGIEKVDEFPVFYLKNIDSQILVEGQDICRREMPENTLLPLSSSTYRITEKCIVKRIK